MGDGFGRQNTLLAMSVCGTFGTVSLWLPSITAGGESGRRLWVAFVVLYGVAGGGYSALFPTMVGEVFGMRNYASGNGFKYVMRGLGAVVGNPVRGSILGSDVGLGRWKGAV